MTNLNPLSLKNLMERIIPISRFNRGEANKIFEEVKKTGVKAVLKNNVCVGVIVEPEQYDEMMEMLEDYVLFFEAEERMKTAEAEGRYTMEEVMTSLNITEEDLNNAEDLEIN